MTTVVVCAGGPIEEILSFSTSMKDQAIFIGADRGALHLFEQGIVPDEAVGDFDSVTAEEYARIQKHVAKIDAYQAEKDETDTELALARALTYHPKEVILTGVTGGRLDHMLSAIHLLSRYQQMYPHILFKIANDTNELQILLPGAHVMPIHPLLPYLSFFAFQQEVKELTLKGFKYPVTFENLSSGMTRFTSNELLQKEGSISFSAGICLMVRSSDG